ELRDWFKPKEQLIRINRNNPAFHSTAKLQGVKRYLAVLLIVFEARKRPLRPRVHEGNTTSPKIKRCHIVT
ncbi:MAG TPA: hypothetical protein PLM34_09585, partial [Lentimicrobium sp.]|nr:hypothetical protein [Lentimicrobium sp.]